MAVDRNTRAKASFWLQLMNLLKILKARHKHMLLQVLDFSKAFDVVPHQRLLHELYHCGIQRTTLNWIQNFLTNRTQKVVNDSFSESARAKSGVPQGRHSGHRGTVVQWLY